MNSSTQGLAPYTDVGQGPYAASVGLSVMRIEIWETNLIDGIDFVSVLTIEYPSLWALAQLLWVGTDDRSLARTVRLRLTAIAAE